MNRDNHRIFLIRHGETDWNKAFRYQGSSDVPLNDEGLRQAALLGTRLSRIRPSRILASPLMRAFRTAETIRERNDGAEELETETRDDLREISFGVWEGLSIPEIKEKDGKTFERWRRAPFSCAPEGGETFPDIMRRSQVLAEELKCGAPGSDTFVVTHGGVLRALIAALLEFDDIDLLWRMRFDNCSISVVDIWNGKSVGSTRSRYPSLLTSNDTHHLRLERDEAIASLVFPF